MSRYVFICEPDKNGVYSIGDRYVNLKQYSDFREREFDNFRCPACEAYQVNNYYRCVLCGYDGRFISYEDLPKFKEENKEKIENIKKNYGR